jgi:hypothetical protein
MCIPDLGSGFFSIPALDPGFRVKKKQSEIDAAINLSTKNYFLVRTTGRRKKCSACKRLE